jgi:DNA-binding beta-propeller fold protein YncE
MMAVHGHERLLVVLALLAILGMLVACDVGSLLGGGEPPSVVIERPPSDVQVALGDTVPIHTTATDSTGVTRVELWVDDSLLATEASPVAEGQASFSVVFRWRADVEGSHKVLVKAYNQGGSVGESAAIIVFVVRKITPAEATPAGPEATPPAPEATPEGPPATPMPPQPTPQGPPPATPTSPPAQPTATAVPPTPTPTSTQPAGPCLPTTVTTISVVGDPKGVAVHGHRVYVALHDSPRVVVINADTNTVLSPLATGAPGSAQGNGIVYHTGSGELFVGNKTDGTVSAIDPSGAGTPDIIASNAEPFGLAVADQYVYVANFAANRVSRIDATTHLGVSLMSTFNKPALMCALGSDVFVPTNGSGPIYRIPAGGTPIGIGPSKTGYFAAAANTTSNRVFVTDRDGGDLLKINANTNTVEDTLHFPADRPYGLAVNSTKGRIYVIAAEADLLYVVDGPTMQIVGSVAIGDQGAVEGGQGIALWGDRIYVSNYKDSTVSVLDDSACP